MPIYAYACHACGHQFDRLQKLSDPDPRDCPQCGQPQVQRQVTAPVFRLAGSGWYETDFKKAGDKKHNLADKGDGRQGAGPAAAAGSEAKPVKDGSATASAADKPASAPSG